MRNHEKSHITMVDGSRTRERRKKILSSFWQSIAFDLQDHFAVQPRKLAARPLSVPPEDALGHPADAPLGLAAAVDQQEQPHHAEEEHRAEPVPGKLTVIAILSFYRNSRSHCPHFPNNHPNSFRKQL